ncbi:glutamate--tRNA ligase family protein [Algoriphagus hitonicola]|uniref:Glutamyl-tRNA synthetase n=1 Tax=Algoriphagus hitonicola TaxID=435880 RepID=A0A1I2RKI8_9BACT|nr:glutamate--tRNA ligase family protein [Algoriphagus hitonicola]SFG41068.1 glutamyl-tRNA synthetase [Algoriphagus hitonicola]
MKFNLTRIAPTPSGFLHLGNAYSFLLTKALAEKTGAKILLRIDDLDRERYRSEYVQDIFDSLDFLEITIDKGPKNLTEFEKEWSQIHRRPLYEQALEKLQETSHIFACTCSRKKIQSMDSSGYYLGHCLERRIPLDRKEAAWRINTLIADLIEFTEYPDSKIIQPIPLDTSFFMVRKKDQMPSYHMTSLVDDHYFEVDLIVRGQDLFSSSIAQTYLSEIVGFKKFKNIVFYHHLILKDAQKKKLSKSDGATSIHHLRKSGKKLSDVFRLIGEMMGSTVPISNMEDFKGILSL